jgi:hypothetical protein
MQLLPILPDCLPYWSVKTSTFVKQLHGPSPNWLAQQFFKNVLGRTNAALMRGMTMKDLQVIDWLRAIAALWLQAVKARFQPVGAARLPR